MDIFEYTLYVLIIKNDEIISDSLVAKLADYLWTNVLCKSQLKICNFKQRDAFQRVRNFQLEDLQKQILAQGSGYFTPVNNSPVVYFKILAQILCFEKVRF
jgi:hypothetical protein